MSKSDKKWPSYAHSKFGKKWCPGLFWAKCIEIWTPNFFPIIYINIEAQTQLEVNWTQIAHFGLQKNTKMAMSQNALFVKCHSPKFLLLLHFSMNLSGTFRIDVSTTQKLGNMAQNTEISSTESVNFVPAKTKTQLAYSKNARSSNQLKHENVYLVIHCQFPLPDINSTERKYKQISCKPSEHLT